MKTYRNPSATKPIYPTDPDVCIIQIESVPFRDDPDPETPATRAYAVTQRTTESYIQDHLTHSTIRSAIARLDTFTDLLPDWTEPTPAV